MNWKNYGLLSDEQFRAITDTVTLDTVIPTIWSPVLERKYEHLLRLQQFAIMNTELENKPGDEVKINIMSDIGMAVEMDETGATGEAAMGSESIQPGSVSDLPYIPETAMTSEIVQTLIPTMKFKAVKMSLKALNRAFVSVMQDVTTKLAYAMASKMEYDCFNALSGTPANPAGTRIGRATPAVVVVGDKMTLTMAKDAKEQFDVTVKMNPEAYFEGDTIVCLLHPYQARDITDDTEWKDLVTHQPNLLKNVFKGELFQYMGVRYVKSTMVKYYAGGVAPTNVAATTMWRTEAALGSGTSKRFWFVATAAQVKKIVPRYQISDFALGGVNALTIAVDATDVSKRAKVVAINYRDGYIDFDKPIGGTAPPTATFAYAAGGSSVNVYDSMFIGRRAFAVAYKMRPKMAQEDTQYGLFTGFGVLADWDVKRLRNENIFKTLTAE